MTDAVTQLDELLIDDPFNEAIDETLLVAGDLLQSRGELRGEHIAHELAMRSASASERLERERAYTIWLAAHAPRLFGKKLEPLRHRPSAMRCRFHGGQLSQVTLDVRRIIRSGTQLSIAELIGLLVSAPVMRHLRELRVRVRHTSEVGEVYDAVVRAGHELPLEFLMVSTTTRPLGHHTGGDMADLREIFPQLWFVTRYGNIAPVLDPELADETSAHELELFAGAAMNRPLRVCLGRGLSSGREHTTKAACDLLADLGPSARVFVPTLDLLLRRYVSLAAAWLLPELPRFGPWVHELLPRVRSITGDVEHYPAEIRALAGHCLHELDHQ